MWRAYAKHGVWAESVFSSQLSHSDSALANAGALGRD